MKRLLLLACLLPGAAAAGHLYRCVGPVGHVSYQTAPCGAGERTDRIIEYVPDSAPAISNAVTVRPNRRSTAPIRANAHGRPIPRHKSAASPCASAKARREARLLRLGLKRSFDELSRIDAAVRAACNGY